MDKLAVNCPSYEVTRGLDMFQVGNVNNRNAGDLKLLRAYEDKLRRQMTNTIDRIEKISKGYLIIEP